MCKGLIAPFCGRGLLQHAKRQLGGWSAAGEQQVQLLRAAAEEEARLGAPVVAFYQRALPALPILLFGFACREGAELVSNTCPNAVLRVAGIACIGRQSHHCPASIVVQNDRMWLCVLVFAQYQKEAGMQVSHELSVPAVSTMLLSVLAWGAAAASSVLLWEALSQRTWTLLRALGAVGTLCVAVVVSVPALLPEQHACAGGLYQELHL